MKELHAIQGPYNGNPPTNASDFSKAKTDGEAAFKKWLAGKGDAQKTAGKALYVAWLTMLDGLAAYSGDSIDFDNTPAGVAWNKAKNTFEVDLIAG
jgi:hypothetical protein